MRSPRSTGKTSRTPSSVEAPPAGAPERPAGPPWFALAVEAAIFCGVFVLTAAGVRAVPPEAAVAPVGAGSVWFFLMSFAAASVLLVLLVRTRRGSTIFSALFLLTVFSGIGILFGRLLGPSAAVVSVSLSILAYYASRTVGVADLVMTLGMAGVAVVLGEGFRPSAVAVILAMLAVYDIIAVLVTGHMATAAAALIRRGVVFALIVPVRPSGLLKRTDQAIQGREFMFLGTGDAVLPALFLASVGRSEPVRMLPVAAGALLGLALTNAIFFAQPKIKPIPALPPIVLGAAAGYLFSLLFV